ncbi:hypothetical protein LEN26_005395 [Aphanomyces euteiches]|nr:hypothetical protein AeMF1_000261 [Aphanomyces euteiches]KAH9138080.1 hypothetical protein LEN26_005395 [Aphanomyces euteiches]KAH9197326.1 hypothetical protein AeNC1_000671 [Aphanomyces euteiches]
MDRICEQYHAEDVGRILLQAQDDLRSMRERVNEQNNVDVNEINAILQRAEADLRAKAEIVLNSVVNNSMKMLPAIEAPGGRTSASKFSSKLAQKRELAATICNPLEPASPTYTQESRFRQDMLSFPIEPMERDRTPGRRPVGRILKAGAIMKKKTTKPNRLLPKMNRTDPSAAPPDLAEEDARGGVFDLQNRGFISTTVDVTPALTHGTGVLQNSKVKIYDRSTQLVKSVPYTNPSGFNMASLKFDMTPIVGSLSSRVDEMTHASFGKRGLATVQIEFPQDPSVPSTSAAPQSLDTRRDLGEEDNSNTIHNLRRNVEKIRGYNELLDTYSLHQFIIRKGKTLSDTPEFISFQRTTEDLWGSVATAIEALEATLTSYSVPLAYVDGQKLMKIAAMDATTRGPADLLSCILNLDEVSSLMRRPGQRYRGSDGKRLAAVVIQSVWRMYITKKRLKNHHGNEDAAKIQRMYRSYSCFCQLQQKLKSVREADMHVWEAQMQRFRANWDRIKTQRRIVVHVPSFSAEERMRLKMENFSIRQNLQMARMCAIADPNVDIVYISPFELSPDVQKYQVRLLQLGGIADPQTRIRMLHPENVERFPDHFSLTTVLLYSPHCLKKIKRFVRGKEAYIVSGTVGPEDKRLAISLQLPLLGIDPDAALLYATRSGAKRLFMAADVNIPIGAHDIYDDDELIQSLSKLIAANLDQAEWLIKIDADPAGTGIATFNAHAMPCVGKLRAERREMKNGGAEYFEQPDVKEAELRNIFSELSDMFTSLVQPCFPDVYPTWADMRAVVLRIGAVIEAYPAKVLGHVRASIFIEPTGGVHITSAHDQLMSPANKHVPLAATFPQTTVPYQAIRGATLAIASSMFIKGVMGYASIDYITFSDPKATTSGKLRQRLWAVQVCPGLTNTAVSFAMFAFLANAQFNPHTGKGHLQPLTTSNRAPDEAPATATQLAIDKILNPPPAHNSAVGPERTYIVLDYIYHPNMTTLHYATFFNTCRLNGVSFDLQRSVGAAFILADSLTAGVVGLLCMGETEKEAFRIARHAVELIGDQVGVQALPDSMTGDRLGNFPQVVAIVRSKSDDPRTNQTRKRK